MTTYLLANTKPSYWMVFLLISGTLVLLLNSIYLFAGAHSLFRITRSAHRWLSVLAFCFCLGASAYIIPYVFYKPFTAYQILSEHEIKLIHMYPKKSIILDKRNLRAHKRVERYIETYDGITKVGRRPFFAFYIIDENNNQYVSETVSRDDTEYMRNYEVLAHFIENGMVDNNLE